MAGGRKAPPPRALPPFVSHVLDLLAPLGPVVARAMFGGWGLSLDGKTFALIAGDELYFKVDDGNRPAYLARGRLPFAPYPDQPHRTMGYYPPPPEALEETDSLLPWARDALAVAGRAALAKIKPRRG
ncbi:MULTISPECIES: TfoX/Sxy family protein [Azospirillaceae]|uniref:TfoX/Sxy family protein n=1 Tax=Azospirillaceae TaxID=2829815 RepID=UPI000B73252C|nr:MULTISPECIES: TfoX/Sxy family protein [Azospirillaceae]MDG5496808.1 TfoX/Sxy family protein [Niveispirillum sp. BGYR6]SNR87265.1 DNA transformation protein [Azospirillum sp. RU38E]SNS03462.1 DNA transformation protein [Azospirillum sp. RU37A]